MKKKILLFISVVLCVSLCSCSSVNSFKLKKQYSIDLIVKGTTAEFWKRVNDGAQAAASMLGIRVNLLGPENEKDYTDQVSSINAAIEGAPDAIILAASDYNLMSEPVERAISSGIPVIMVDSDVESEKKTAYVGTDNVQLGNMLAKQVIESIQASGEVGVVSFVAESYPSVQREKGFRDGMQQDSRFTLLDTVYCDSMTERAYEITLELISAHPEMVSIVGLNAQSAEGAAKAVSESGLDIPVFAIDCLPGEAMYMEEGVIKSALLQNPYQMGYYSVMTTYDHLTGKRAENFYTDIYIVTKELLFEDLYEQLIFPFDS